jgi:hypothetical protein
MAEVTEKKSAVSDVGAWAMNVVSSVGIIMANKQLMSPAGYAFSFGESPSFSISLSSPLLNLILFRWLGYSSDANTYLFVLVPLFVDDSELVQLKLLSDEMCQIWPFAR